MAGKETNSSPGQPKVINRRELYYRIKKCSEVLIVIFSFLTYFMIYLASTIDRCWNKNPYLYFAAISALIAVIFAFIGIWKKPSESEFYRNEEELEACRAELEQAKANRITDIREITRDYLSVILNDKLKFNGRHRATLYFYDAKNKKFINVSRYSQETDLSEHGRNEIPAVEGCLEKLWKDKEVKEFTISSALKGEAYIRFQMREYNLPEESARGLRMKTYHYVGKRISYRDNRDNLGIILFESESEGVLILFRIKECLNKGHEKVLAFLLEHYGNIILGETADKDYARGKGF